MMEMEGWIILHILHITYYSLFVRSHIPGFVAYHLWAHALQNKRLEIWDYRQGQFISITTFQQFFSFGAEKSIKERSTVTNRLGSSDPDYPPSHRVPSSPSSSLLPVQEDNSFLRLCAICFKFVSNLEGVQRDIRVVEVGHKNVFQMSLRTFTLTRSLPMVNSGSHPRWSHGGCNWGWRSRASPLDGFQLPGKITSLDHPCVLA